MSVLFRRRAPERTMRCTCGPTVRTPGCEHGHLIEDHPYMVDPDLFARWDHEPRGPFRLQRWNADRPTPSSTSIAVCSGDLLAAVDLFVSRALPPAPQMAAFLIDESYRLVLGYAATERLISELGYPAWFGVGAAFDALTPLVGDPMTVAIWESCARETAR